MNTHIYITTINNNNNDNKYYTTFILLTARILSHPAICDQIRDAVQSWESVDSTTAQQRQHN
jgi:hypothetical protein